MEIWDNARVKISHEPSISLSPLNCGSLDKSVPCDLLAYPLRPLSRRRGVHLSIILIFVRGERRHLSANTDVLKDILTLLRKNQNLLERIGWFPTEPLSPRWWGGLDSADEIIISALLVQQQTWEVVKRTLEKIKQEGYSSLTSISKLSLSEVEGLIRSSNFYKTKARRLLNIANASTRFGGLEKMLRLENRDELLSLEGIGEETADCSLLFAGNQLLALMMNFSSPSLRLNASLRT